MFKRIISAVVAVSMIVTPAFAGSYSSGRSYSSGSSFRSSSFSSGSSYRSSSYRPSYSSGSSYSYKPSYNSSYKSTATVSTPKYTSGSSYSYRPSQTRVVSRPSYGYSSGSNRTTVVHNNYGGGYGGGHGIASNPFFWMWMMDRPHQTAPVVVNGGGVMPQGGVAGAPVVYQDNGPGFFWDDLLGHHQYSDPGWYHLASGLPVSQVHSKGLIMFVAGITLGTLAKIAFWGWVAGVVTVSGGYTLIMYRYEKRKEKNKNISD